MELYHAHVSTNSIGYEYLGTYKSPSLAKARIIKHLEAIGYMGDFYDNATQGGYVPLAYSDYVERFRYQMLVNVKTPYYYIEREISE